MKDASRQTRWIYLEVPPRLLFSERRTAGSRVTGSVQVRLVARTSDNRACFLDSRAQHNLPVWSGGVEYPNYLPLLKVGFEAPG
jgi:hypothetical protein